MYRVLSSPVFWDVLGTWVFGAATFFVGIVALRPKLKPSLNIYCNVTPGKGTLKGQDVIVINVANSSAYPITINNVIWKFPIPKISARQVITKTDYSTELPDTIQPGMQSTYMVNWNGLKKQIPGLLNMFGINKPRFLRKMHVILNTSLGVVKSPVQPALYEEMINFLKLCPAEQNN